jgi:hypothetical protein
VHFLARPSARLLKAQLFKEVQRDHIEKRDQAVLNLSLLLASVWRIPNAQRSISIYMPQFRVAGSEYPDCTSDDFDMYD